MLQVYLSMAIVFMARGVHTFSIIPLPAAHRQQQRPVQLLLLSDPSVPSKATVTALRATPSSGNGDGKLNKRKRQKSADEMTLYDIMGASQKDSQEQLKVRYKALVKKLHPDAQIASGGVSIIGYADLSDINAAWEILSDPKERLRYDREINAKAFAEGLEAVVSLGIQTAIPFLRRTAKTTAAAVETSSRAVNEGAEELQKSLGIFELEQNSRQLEQRAAMESTKASKMKKELANLPTRRLKTLESSSKNNNKFTAAEALRILKSFDTVKEFATVSNDVTAFGVEERKFQTGKFQRVETEKARRSAERQADQAARAEETALKKLQEAQRALEQAQENSFDAQERQDNALQQEQTAQVELTKIETKMQQSREKVRTGLLKKEDKFLDYEAKSLKQEIKSAEELAKRLKIQANKVKAESEYKKIQDQ
mmetsp:Transcript_1548/g.2426  ORF Transcript_1548/g.2426 Transcript_1548/m.2426 type:complete len:426 (-) Transcript_1548:219-1496(-)